MKFSRNIVMGMLIMASLGACSPEKSGGDEAQEQAAPKVVAAENPGKTAFMQCIACHSIEEGQPQKLGPNLAGIVGRKAGSKEGYAYSEAMVSSGIIWTPEKLDAFLKAPQTTVAGTKMIFTGVADDSRRKALIEYLADPEASNAP